MRAKDALGAWGEDRARRYLRGLGWQILTSNWRLRDGELDIIAMDGPTLVFVEVKTRRGSGAGDPLEAVTSHKLRALRRLAGAWLAEQEQHYPSVRLDVIGIAVPRRGRPQLSHVSDVGEAA